MTQLSPKHSRKHTHPFMILLNLRRFLVLAIIPVLRGVLTALRGNFSKWSDDLWFDLLILGFIILFAVIRWWRCTYHIDKEYLTQRKGFFTSQLTQLPWRQVTVLKIYQPFYMRPFQACYLRADTLGGNGRNSDITLVLYKKQVDEISQLYELEFHKKPHTLIYTPRLRSILGFSLLTSNSFVGVFYLATFISQSGKILGKEFPTMLIGSFENLSRSFSLHVPPAATAIACLFIAAWLIGVIFTISRYYDYKVEKNKHIIQLSGGLFNHQELSIDSNLINHLNIRQNVITFFLQTYSLYVSAAGCGKERYDVTCVIPMENEDEFEKQLHQLFPTLRPSPITLRPPRFGFMRFIWQPLLTLGIVFVLPYIGAYFNPSWGRFLRFVSFMALIPAFCFLTVRVIEFARCGIGKDDDSFTVQYSKGFTLHTQLIPKDKIVKIIFRQRFFQKYRNKCDVWIYTQSEGQKKHRCKNLKFQQAKEFFSIKSLDDYKKE